MEKVRSIVVFAGGGIQLNLSLLQSPSPITFDCASHRHGKRPPPSRYMLGARISSTGKPERARSHTRQHARGRIVARRSVLRASAQPVLADHGRTAGNRSGRHGLLVAHAGTECKRLRVVGCAAILSASGQPGCGHQHRFARRKRFRNVFSTSSGNHPYLLQRRRSGAAFPAPCGTASGLPLPAPAFDQPGARSA